MISKLPVLYKKTSTGAIQMWEIAVKDSTIITTYGQVNGKKQTTEDTISVGKNIGKSNETTAVEQAELEAKSQWEKKSKKGYVLKIEDAQGDKVNEEFITGGISPMLAHVYEKHGSKITFPAAVQPKLDGHRCIAIIDSQGKVTLWSRTRKPITGVPHIIAELESFGYKDLIFDGELYNHDYRDKFEELTSFIRRPQAKEGCEVVQYWIYDMVTDDPFRTRHGRIGSYISPRCKYLVRVQTRSVEDEEDLTAMFVRHQEQGYEGTMVRNMASAYEQKRSYSLQKMKEFDDAEFKVVDVEEGRGKMAGKAVFICEATKDTTFKCKLVGSLDDLTAYYNHKDKWIGKMLTVKYQGISNYGVPRFPIGLRFRQDV